MTTATRTPAPEVPETPARPLTTDYGTGFLPLLVRSLLHPLVLHTAIASEWEVTNGQARAMLDIGRSSVNAMVEGRGILSEDANTAIDVWLTVLNAMFDQVPTADPTAALTPDLRQVIHGTYAHGLTLLAVLDADLLGIESDGGRIP